MIPAILEPRKDGRSSFRALEKYLTEERKPGTKEIAQRGPLVLSGNLLSAQTAATEMRVVATQNPLVADAAMHFQLAWKPGETPSAIEWQRSAEKAIEALGFGKHQYLIVAHNDKMHFHVHVMLNRVEPETYKAHNPRLSLLTLHKVARELEHEYGWAEAPGLYRWDSERNEPVRNSKPELSAIREKSRATRGNMPPELARQDHFRDELSLKAFASQQPAETLRKLLAGDTDWQRLHLALARHGLTIGKADKGGYIVGVEGSEVCVKASDVFRFAFSGKEARSRTDAKLGAFEPPTFGKLLDPPVIDYSQSAPEEERRPSMRFIEARDAGLLPKNLRTHLPPRSIADIPTIHSMRSLSQVSMISPVGFDRMEVQPGDARKDNIRLVVRKGAKPEENRESREATEAGKTPEVRRQEWMAKEAAAGQQRRQERIEERARERQTLKAEFQAVRAGDKARLHEHVESARARRNQLTATWKKDKVHFRSSAVAWQIRKAILSQLTFEFIQAKFKLNGEIAEERRGISRTSYQKWVEERAEAGDKRAVAQMRGWRYQDSRNLRQIDGSKGTGELGQATKPEEHGEADWQEIANERLRQLREQPRFREALKGLVWKANSKTGSVVYSINGRATLIDRGKKMVVLTPDVNATRVALQMAIHKFGRVIDAQGTAEWQAQLIEAAVQDQVRVVFSDPELQGRFLGARRQAQLAEVDRERARALFRHYDAELINRYGHGLDPSQADRVIAERMIKGGLSEQQIVAVLGELSRQGRAEGGNADDPYCRKIAAQAAKEVRQGPAAARDTSFDQGNE